MGYGMPKSHVINTARHVSNLLSLPSDDSVLDAGCDNGLLLFEVKPFVDGVNTFAIRCPDGNVSSSGIKFEKVDIMFQGLQLAVLRQPL